MGSADDTQVSSLDFLLLYRVANVDWLQWLTVRSRNSRPHHHYLLFLGQATTPTRAYRATRHDCMSTI